MFDSNKKLNIQDYDIRNKPDCKLNCWFSKKY